MRAAVPGHDKRDAEDAHPRAAWDPNALSGDALAQFGEVTDRLGTLREMQRRMSADIEAYARLVEACLDTNSAFEELAEGARRTLAALDPLQDPDLTRRFSVQANGCWQYLQSISRTGRTLSAVASLSRTTAASFGVTALQAYLDDLSRISGQIRRDSQAVTDHLHDVVACRQGVQDGIRPVQRSLSTLNSDLDHFRLQLAESARRECSAAKVIVLRGTELDASGKAEIKGFVAAIQFVDRLSQRLDHLATILSHDNGHVRRLGQAQIVSISRSMRETAGRTRNGMDAIAALSEAGSALFLSGDIAETIQSGLVHRAKAAEHVDASVSVLAARMLAIREQLARAAEAHAAVEARFSDLETSSKQVATTAINSVLLVSRSGAAQGALATLSTEVRMTATRCLAAVGGCQAAMNALIELTMSAQGDVLEQSDRLSEALAGFRTETDAARGRLDDLRRLCARAGERVEAMMPVVQAVCGGMDLICDLADELDAMGDGLDVTVPDGTPPDPELLTRLWDLYTMDEERSVHAEVFADFAPLRSAAPLTASADLDDVLF